MESDSRQIVGGLYRAIVGTAIMLALFLVALFTLGKPGPVLVELPWFVPVISLFQALTLFSVAFLSLGRYNVLRDTASFWIGMGAAGYGIALSFYALTWPGLLPWGGSIIGHLPGTPAWFVQFGITIFSVLLLAAILIPWPRGRVTGVQLILLVSAWSLFLILLFSLAVAHEQYLPALITSTGTFTPAILVWNALVAILFAAGAILSTRHYLRTGDALLGYIAFAQMVYAFSILATVGGMRRYDLLWYVLRVMLTGGALVVFFGLLSEYVYLFRRERERAEEVLKAEESLIISEANLARAQAVAHLGSWRWDLVHDVVTWSLELYRIFGVDHGTFIPSNEAANRLIHPDDRQLQSDLVAIALAGKQVEPVEVRIVRPDGEERIVLASGYEVEFDLSGKPVLLFGTVQDITERKRDENRLRESEEQYRRLSEELEQRVRDRTAQLESANRELEAFSYSVSHDLRAPLRIIDGFSQALEEDFYDKLDEGGKENIKFIRGNARKMGHLIDDLLRLSRIGRAEMHFDEVNLSEIAQSIANELQRQNPDRNVALAIQPHIIAPADPDLIRIALENLLSNAWKFTSKKPGAYIEFGESRRDDERVYFVKDNGAGFDMVYAAKLFTPFQRLHTESEFPGTGIGLAIVRRIINRHGGKLWAEGEVGKGARFCFTLNPGEKET